jgi:hypothetical protein
MVRYARTYGSRLYPQNIDQSWQFPTGPELDTFGVPVPEKMKTFGLEEFNFNNKLMDIQLAYVPCYGTERTYPRPFVDELHLMYLDRRNPRGCYMHYATLYNVQSLRNEDIKSVRPLLVPNLDEIYFRAEVQQYFGNDMGNFNGIIRAMLNSNIIASNQNNKSFLVNVRYEKIEILDKPVCCQNNNQMASQWKKNMIYPSDCNKK